MQALQTSIPRKGLFELEGRRERAHAEMRVLIVEDDLTLQPLWERAFKTKNPAVKLDWATSVSEAEKLIHLRFSRGAPYELIISDIFLEGNATGVDLWNRYGEEALNFAFVSGLPVSKYELMMSLDFGCPTYLKKPLTLQKCEEIADLTCVSEA